MVLPHMVSHMVSPVVGLQKGPSCCPTALPTALLGGATAASLLLFEREQNCRRALGTVVLSGFSKEGTEL